MRDSTWFAMASTEILWVGRLTGPKGELAYRLMTEIAPRFPQARFTLVGGPLSERFSAAAGANVTLVDFVSDVRPYMEAADLVIGAGRVAMEAMACARPVIAVGERAFIGLVNAQTIGRARATNFGDCAETEFPDIDAFIAELDAVLAGKVVADVGCYADYLAEYQNDFVCRQVMDVYQEAALSQRLARYREIPVLTYHRVVEVEPAGSRFRIFVTRDELAEQLANLRKRGFTPVTFKDLLDGPLPKKPVILTFDDGYEDNYLNLLPLLEKYDARAVIFALGDRGITTNYWDVPEGEPEAALMSDAQLRACHDSGRIEIGSHGLRHRHLPQLGADELATELQQSRDTLSALLGTEIVSFAYPYGDYAEREVEAVRAAGYRFGVATVSGPVSLADDLYRVRRVQVFPATKPFAFWKKTSGYYYRYCKWKGKDF